MSNLMRFTTKQLCASTLGIVLSCISVTGWAAMTGLQGIVLDSSGLETKVTLKSDTRLPYQIVSQSADKIVIDISSVDPTRSIPTDFANAENIEQVILKPVSSNRLRMVIRGEGLGNPIIASGKTPLPTVQKIDPVFSSESDTAPVTQSVTPKAAQASVKSPDAQGIAMTALATEAPAPTVSESTSDVSATESAPTESPDTVLDSADPDAGNTSMASIQDLGDRTPMGKLDYSEQDTTNTEDSPLEETLGSGLDILNNLSRLVGPALAGKGLWFRILGLSTLILSLGLFIRYKLRTSDGPHRAAGTSVLNTFFGPKRKRPQGRRRRPNLMSEAGIQHTSRQTERPVGLSGFHHPELEPVQPSRPLVNRAQAIHQYAQQALPAVSEPRRRDSQEIDLELKQSINLRQAVESTHNMKRYQKGPAKSPAANSMASRPPRPQAPAKGTAESAAPQRPLPRASASGQSRTVDRTPPVRQPVAQPKAGLPANNDQVLDFLRSVAELMEKDGRPELANGVRKGMAQKQP